MPSKRSNKDRQEAIKKLIQSYLDKMKADKVIVNNLTNTSQNKFTDKLRHLK